MGDPTATAVPGTHHVRLAIAEPRRQAVLFIGDGRHHATSPLLQQWSNTPGCVVVGDAARSRRGRLGALIAIVSGRPPTSEQAVR